MTAARVHIAVILLAAGSSSRFGEPKQLVRFRNTSLARHLTRIALSSRASPVIVVVGAHARKIRAELSRLPVMIVHNRFWRRGISTSMRAGLKHVPPDARGALFMLCDQPFATVRLFRTMMRRFHTQPRDIIACTYGKTTGVPALFPRRLFPRLLALKGDKGAKSILLKCRKEVFRIPFPRGGIDIDTRGDLESLMTRL